MYNSVDYKRAQSEEELCENEQHYFVRDCVIAPLPSAAAETERRSDAELSLAMCARLQPAGGPTAWALLDRLCADLSKYIL